MFALVTVEQGLVARVLLACWQNLNLEIFREMACEGGRLFLFFDDWL